MRALHYVVFLVIGHGATSPMFFALAKKLLTTAHIGHLLITVSSMP